MWAHLVVAMEKCGVTRGVDIYNGCLLYSSHIH